VSGAVVFEVPQNAQLKTLTYDDQTKQRYDFPIRIDNTVRRRLSHSMVTLQILL
jgi:hypothetical protein